MRKILVCQHVPHEILGTLNPLFKQNGFRIRYVNFGRHPHAKPSLDGYFGLVVLGGPMNVDEVEKHPHLGFEVELIQQAIKKDLPVLGICLGAQLIAKALGAKVFKNPVKEIGWYNVCLTEEGKKDPILKHFRPTERLFQWHGDSFDLPKEALHLASSLDCEQQAFRYGKKVYGFQFHLEVDEPIIERWLKVPGNKKELELLKGQIEAEKIDQETPLYVEKLKMLSEETFGEFIKLFGVEKKFKGLASR
ncbi:MAG: hypothetical protein A3F82_03140 [Deltaproteobacteria bacterium RIFCSPLOWO2_12_FULL_44_12]|nr:MAG: hypothetical protein A2712_06330 [Deltaproteobacteria bacterium RIFCSPHIGHO2_01_FULL_43_49]OGQ16002.1 MAG: hypothetical protein A3D22_06340 [Deltaproteobacteria bacterium RIFCSPHIGHO2_02_FULL_44_53]OGQ28958.1 MAG: hypothetical protein A3D98_03925 [Deltaproteobacteria bacterium RIFCSPHIGHO2_12_FULL_44_21]OGQ33171.1 MAG: hypothetical protein A2979_04100 [Deltaproteobacteria bacterium RIFCSPLOWO2_01_FULL_45_74]OGQ42267.1 MAG: hypothetical protein A3I70_06405 [Deltaproteobacteria bacterium 